MNSGSASRLRPISEDQEIPAGATQQATGPIQARHEATVATGLLLLALKSLSQRTLVALDGLFTTGCVASAFALWYVTLPQPSPAQLVGLGGYGAFILGIHLVKRRAGS